MTQSDRLLHAYKTLPEKRCDGEFAKYDENGNMLYDTNAWLLHCIGVPDEVLLSLTGNIGDDPECFPRQDLVKRIKKQYGLSKEQLAQIEDLNDHRTIDSVDSYIYSIYRTMKKQEENKLIRKIWHWFWKKYHYIAGVRFSYPVKRYHFDRFVKHHDLMRGE